MLPVQGITKPPNVGSGGVVNIQELSSDPLSPVAEEAWVLRSGTTPIPDGTPIGLLLALTYTGNMGSSFTYQFSYFTNESTIIRTTLS